MHSLPFEQMDTEVLPDGWDDWVEQDAPNSIQSSSLGSVAPTKREPTVLDIWTQRGVDPNDEAAYLVECIVAGHCMFLTGIGPRASDEDERTLVKQLGADFNRNIKQWYAPLEGRFNKHVNRQMEPLEAIRNLFPWLWYANYHIDRPIDPALERNFQGKVLRKLEVRTGPGRDVARNEDAHFELISAQRDKNRKKEQKKRAEREELEQARIAREHKPLDNSFAPSKGPLRMPPPLSDERESPRKKPTSKPTSKGGKRSRMRSPPSAPVRTLYASSSKMKQATLFVAFANVPAASSSSSSSSSSHVGGGGDAIYLPEAMAPSSHDRVIRAPLRWNYDRWVVNV